MNCEQLFPFMLSWYFNEKALFPLCATFSLSFSLSNVFIVFILHFCKIYNLLLNIIQLSLKIDFFISLFPIAHVSIYCVMSYSLQPGKINGGLPRFGPPPFSTVVGNRTLNFTDMLAVFGAEGLVMPLVTILESVAIAKAFGKCISGALFNSYADIL